MGSAINPDDIKRFEVTEVYTHPDAKVDIVFVHGLNGHPRQSWTAKNGVFWPTQLLPASLKLSQARILMYGYNADVWTFGSHKSPSSDLIHQHAQTLLTTLSLERKSEQTTEHPIIWVCHSLGGILVKRALELSADLQSKNADDLRSIFVSTYGIMFLGTPHIGADPAKWGLILQGMVNALVPRKFMDTQSQLIQTLQTNNETLQNINLKFLDIYQRFKVCMVHESTPTDFKGTKAFIVDRHSAGPLLPDVQYFGIEATHSGMSKFESKNSPGYTNVSVTLMSWVQESPQVVKTNWEIERIQRKQKKDAEVAAILGYYASTPNQSTSAVNEPSTSQVPIPATAQPPHRPTQIQGPPSHPTAQFGLDTAEDPSSPVDNSTITVQYNVSIEPDAPTEDPDTAYFIKPSGFRPNSLFVGRGAELADMHKLLFDKKRRKEGTSAVLIQSLPGGGKTHLARQYLYDHKDDFPGGIFWVRAKSLTELAAGYWDIARKAALKHCEGEDAKLLKDPQQFIKMVRKWLNRRRDWLLVLDGIHFGDTEALEKFIPDSPNTSLIYTSTERSVTGNYHFKNPQIIRLPLLSAREAQRLLLLELDKKEPFSRDDLRHSTELVQAMGFLPVVIHAVAQRLKTTDEPLSKFARSYVSEPRLRGLGTYKAVVDQLKGMGAHEALNLIYLLCFFSQHIPVEMISLGLKALDVAVKTMEPISGRSLNNTFKILIMFALIDRNYRDDTIHSSQSSKGSQDILADNVDVIRLHSVVQGFFFDTLAAAGTLPIWLDRAVRVFSCSYDMASDRIIRKTNSGLVEDYRLYEIHGNRLNDHLVKNLSKHLLREQRAILEDAQSMLEPRLLAIKSEIERRTPESSHVIAGGRPNAFQISIFDRTSSSSETGPETPGSQSNAHSRVSTWGLEPGKDQHESPSSLTHDIEYIRRMEAVYRQQFPLPQQEDPGYESDREGGSVAMTIQPSQRTIHQDSPLSPGGPWEEVKSRKSRPRPDPLVLHRTVKNLEKSRYRDSAGAYRAVSAIDPRVSHETAQGFLHRSSSRAQSRGRISGQSIAEVSLTHINQNSPPPARGGGMIQDRRSSSQRGSERGRLMTGTASYASAVLGSTRDTIAGFKELVRPSTEPPATNANVSPPPERPSSSAMASLQKFPIEVIKPSPTPEPHHTPRAPYPTSPYLHPASDTEIYQMPGRFSQENLHLGPESYSSNLYPRMEGMPPIERTGRTTSSSPTQPYPSYQKQNESESLPASILISRSNLSDNSPFLSYSSPNIQINRPHSNSNPYYPGRPELSNQEGGYTSQPMSRDPSRQSTHSNQSAHSTGPVERRRRPSFAETEPPPQLPVFSPRIPPTSYQVYERMKEKERGERERSRERGGHAKISPRLGYARSALIEKLEDWGGAVPPIPNHSDSSNTATTAQRKFNPTAPTFSPLPSPSFRTALPPAPANSMLSSTTSSTYPSSYPSPQQNYSSYHPQQPHNSPSSFQSNNSYTKSQAYSSPRSFMTGTGTGGSYPSPLQPSNTPISRSDFQLNLETNRQDRGREVVRGDDWEGEKMERSGSGSGSRSGGVRINDGRVIEFGDFPEGVRVDEARERVLRSWSERERVERERRGEGMGLGLGIRGVRR